MSVSVFPFGTRTDGRAARLFLLDNGRGLRAAVTDYGAALVSLWVGDTDVVLGYDGVSGYESGSGHLGAVVGRSANRIEGARFLLDGREVRLTPNEGENNLHSGPAYYGGRFWDAAADPQGACVRFSLRSPDGDQGFPGDFRVSVTYSLTADGALELAYEGVSDQPTAANLTNHAYFNLNGHGSGTVLGHALRLYAGSFTPVKSSASIPTGELRPVAGTAFDFRTAKPLGRDIGADEQQLRFTGGYDHNFAVDGPAGELRPAAEAVGDRTGIRMTAYTDLPGVQLYTGNFLRGQTGKGGAVYAPRTGFCLETQYFPNAVNTPGFRKPFLAAGERYHARTVYRFG